MNKVFLLASVLAFGLVAQADTPYNQEGPDQVFTYESQGIEVVVNKPAYSYLKEVKSLELVGEKADQLGTALKDYLIDRIPASQYLKMVDEGVFTVRLDTGVLQCQDQNCFFERHERPLYYLTRGFGESGLNDKLNKKSGQLLIDDAEAEKIFEAAKLCKSRVFSGGGVYGPGNSICTMKF